MSTNKKVSLVIFTCSGREHLLTRTITSFKKACKYSFSNTILAIDGQISPAVIDQVNPDIVLQSFKRKGYVQNITTALKMIDTPYFFWLEDDWDFSVEIPANDFLDLLNDDKVSQVILSKNDLDDSSTHYADNYYISFDGFSANPGFCKTEIIQLGFSEIAVQEKDNHTQLLSFETFLNDYTISKALITLRYYLNGGATVEHSGHLESTAREYHMINSIDTDKSLIDKEYISGFGSDKKISFKNQIGLFFKLWLAIASLSIKLWSAREAYDFAFRIYLASLKKFKN